MDYSYIFKLLSLPDDGSISIDNVEVAGDTKYVYISRPPIPTYCPNCSCRMHSEGIYKRKIKHPILQDSTCIIFIVSQRKWKCTNCKTYVNESYPFFKPYKQSTDITPMLILEAMKDLSRSTASIARQFHLSDTKVHDIFTAFIDLPRLKLPEFLSVDEVHIDISENEKYALVLMDFASGQIIDILHNRWQSTAEDYFLSIPYDERKNVKFIISDAYKSYMDYPQQFFPNAVSVLDSFHVIKFLTGRINDYINLVMKSYKKKDREALDQSNFETNRDNKTIKESREVILLKKYRWVLLKNQDDINHSHRRYYHRSLGIYADTYMIEKMFLELDPRFPMILEAKEKYISFNKTSFDSEDAAMSELNKLITEFKASRSYIPREFSEYLDKYKNEIVRSFTVTEVSWRNATDSDRYYARLSNGPMESFNRKPKDYKRNSRGFSNFDYTRNRILWSTRNHPAIRNMPKPQEEIHSYRGKKRGNYKVKNN